MAFGTTTIGRQYIGEITGNQSVSIVIADQPGTEYFLKGIAAVETWVIGQEFCQYPDSTVRIWFGGAHIPIDQSRPGARYFLVGYWKKANLLYYWETNR